MISVFPDLSINVSDVLRSISLVCGVVLFLHFHCMANFIRRSSHFVKWLLPVTTGSGAGLTFSAITGDMVWCSIFSVVGLTCVLAIQMAAWKAGVHISDYLDRVERIRKKVKSEIDNSVSPESELQNYMNQPYTTPAELQDEKTH